MINSSLSFYEFFAGGGLARLGLGSKWQCLFANDWCEKKAKAYRLNFSGAPEPQVEDIGKLAISDFPKAATLAWASFPCQDLSLAGNGLGLNGQRSGTFWSFWRLMAELALEGRKTPLIVLENVTGAITSNNGEDFKGILKTLILAGYRVGPLVIDAVHFVPQSRPRLFIIAFDANRPIPKNMKQTTPNELWHSKPLRIAYSELPDELKAFWVWWNLPNPFPRKTTLSDLIEEEPSEVRWHNSEETKRLLELMTSTNFRKVEQAKALKKRIVGTIYKRTRRNELGEKVQRAEVRFDQVSGCLRTPTGGSSRQLILLVEGKQVRSRLLSSREAARLMGVADTYQLPENYNDAYHLMGDGLVVPVVRWLEKNLLTPLVIGYHNQQLLITNTGTLFDEPRNRSFEAVQQLV